MRVYPWKVTSQLSLWKNFNAVAPLAVATLAAFAALTSASAQEHAEAAVTGNVGESAAAGNDAEALAKQLSNPISSLISVPFQNNWDFGAGPNGDGYQWKMNIQPVVPISISEDWNVIWRTILPVISQKDVSGTKAAPSGSQDGIGDTQASLFFSPKEPTVGGLVWGVGPAFSFPTANEFLGSEQWGVGPTMVALKQDGPWTYGFLVNHLWDFAGDASRPNLNNTFIQPFLSHTNKQSTTWSINAESSYNWDAEQWTVPINVGVSQVVHFGQQPVQFQVGGRYYAEAPDQGPDWGVRFAVTLLFPK